MKQREDTTGVGPETTSKDGRKPYETPLVRDYGALAALTAGGSGFNPEGMSGMIGMN
jgi:hypothetical protein